MSSLRCLLALSLLLAAQSAFAAVKGRVRASIDTERDIWVGQQINLNLEVMTTGYRFSDIQFNLPEVSGAFLLQTDSTTIKLSEVIHDETWQIIRYPLALYPQKPGIINVPPIKVRFNTTESYGASSRNYDLQSQTLTFNVLMPPGVIEEGLVVTTSSFDLEYQWTLPTKQDGDAVQTADVGDAITLNVSRRARDTSGMLLNPIPVFRADGLRAYPATPDVEDHVDRGALSGERKDSITWMIEQPGLYTWPGLRFEWWDPSSRQLKEKLVPGLSLSVAASSNTAAAGANAAPRGKTWTAWSLAALLLGLAGLAVWRGWPALSQWNSKRLADQRGSEKARFDAVKMACREGNPSAAYQAISQWLASSSFSPDYSNLQAFAAATGEAELEKQLLEMQTALVTPDTRPWDGKPLLSSVSRARKQVLEYPPHKGKGQLPELNPH